MFKKGNDNGKSLDGSIKIIIGLKIVSSEESFEELNLVYVGIVFH